MWRNLIDLSRRSCRVASDSWYGDLAPMCWWVEGKLKESVWWQSFAQLTASLVKPLAFPRPGGHNLILEWDIFYPLPDSWRVPKKPTKAPPPPPETTTKAPEVSDDHDHSDHDHSGEIWMPSSGWVSDVIEKLSGAEAKPADKRNWKPPQVNRQINT